MSPDFILAFSPSHLPFSLSTSRGRGRRGHCCACVPKGDIQDQSTDLMPSCPSHVALSLGSDSAGEGGKLPGTVWVAGAATSKPNPGLCPK